MNKEQKKHSAFKDAQSELMVDALCRVSTATGCLVSIEEIKRNLREGAAGLWARNGYDNEQVERIKIDANSAIRAYKKAYKRLTT